MINGYLAAIRIRRLTDDSVVTAPNKCARTVIAVDFKRHRVPRGFLVIGITIDSNEAEVNGHSDRRRIFCVTGVESVDRKGSLVTARAIGIVNPNMHLIVLGSHDDRVIVGGPVEDPNPLGDHVTVGNGEIMVSDQVGITVIPIAVEHGIVPNLELIVLCEQHVDLAKG